MIRNRYNLQYPSRYIGGGIIFNKTSDKASTVLGDIYKSRKEMLTKAIHDYSNICSLPVIEHQSSVGREMYEYCRRRTGLFVIVALYSQREGIFLLRDIADGLGWELPGTSIQPRIDFTLQDAVLRVINKYIPGTKIGELEPVAVVRNVFTYEGNNIEHLGLAFMARSRNITHTLLDKSMPEVQGQFVVDPGDEILRYANKAIFSLVRKKLLSHPVEPAEEEIISSERYLKRKRIHKATLSKAFKRFSYDRIKNEVFKIIGTVKGLTFLDVSCGDNELVFDIAHAGARLCVANDISWPTVELLIEINKKRGYNNILFTNNSATNLPFGKVFDVVLCKNTLHHMRNPDEFRALAENLIRVCKGKIILIEIEDPEYSSLIARWLHRYWYTKYLGDVGHYFFTANTFQTAIQEYFNSRDIRFSQLNTIKGCYLFAVITI